MNTNTITISHLTDEDLLQLVKRVKQEWSFSVQTAEKNRSNPRVVYKVKTNKTDRRKMPRVEKEWLQKQIASGKSIAAIAQESGYHTSSLYLAKDRFKIKLPKRSVRITTTQLKTKKQLEKNTIFGKKA